MAEKYEEGSDYALMGEDGEGQEAPEAKTCLESFSDIVVPCLANFSAAYNFGVIDVILQSSHCGKSAPGWVSSSNTAASFVGAIIGQVTLGYAGDIIGRRNAFLVTLSLIIFGALASGLLTWGTNKYSLLVLFRIILGIGLGGVYPLSAVSVGESSTPDQKSRKVAISFSYQVLGVICYPLIAAACLYGVRSNEWKWRVMAIVGAIPSIITLPKQMATKDSKEFTQAKQRSTSTLKESESPLLVALRNPKMRRRLIGTAVAWFCFDVTAYGVGVFTPYILEVVLKIHGSCKQDGLTLMEVNHAQDTLATTSLYTSLLGLVGVPAMILNVYLVADNKLGRKNLQLYGFTGQCLSNLSFAIAQSFGADSAVIMFFFITVTFFNWFGNSVTTYLLPQETFPAEIRSGMNGLSAACGKLGAAVGVAVFQPLSEAKGLQAPLYLCSAVAVCGLVITQLYVVDVRKEAKQQSLIKMDPDMQMVKLG